MKKFLAILLAAMMLLAVTAAFADEAATTTPTTYTITITGDKGHTYEAYQIFTGDLSGSVLSNIVLGPFPVKNRRRRIMGNLAPYVSVRRGRGG